MPKPYRCAGSLSPAGAACPLARYALSLVAGVALALFSPPALAGGWISADYSRGAISGRVVDLATGKPLAGATVAVHDDRGRIIAWSRTNVRGEYMIAGDPAVLLRIPRSRHRGLLEQVCRGIGDMMSIPVAAVGTAVKVVKDTASMKTVETVAVSAATGNPTPVAAQVLGNTVSALHSTRNDTSVAAVKMVFGDRPNSSGSSPDCRPGEALLTVIAPGYKEGKCAAAAFWLDAPESTEFGKLGPNAYMETVQLAPTSDAKAKSTVAGQAILLSDPVIEPPLAPAGGEVTVRVRLVNPTGMMGTVRIFAREPKRHAVVELMPDQDGTFDGTLKLDPHTPVGGDCIVIVGLRAEPLDVALPLNAKADPLLEFVRQLDDLAPNKRYEYDPRIFACANRVDASITVLDPRHGSPLAGAESPTVPDALSVLPPPPAPPPAPARPGEAARTVEPSRPVEPGSLGDKKP